MNTPTDPLEQEIAIIVGVVHKLAKEGKDDTVRATKDLLALIHTREQQARIDATNATIRENEGHCSMETMERLATLNKELKDD